MKILLLKPDWTPPGGRGQVRYARSVKFTPVALGILAALSGGHDVRVADGGFEGIPLDEEFDLVGITVTTFASLRAFELARRFRCRGAQVVLGGVHASLMPEECLRHADAVVVGEAEYVWEDVLRDARRRRLSGIYRAERITDMKDVPAPRRDLLHESGWFAAVEASRGCPFQCGYCYLPSVPWSRHRTRPLENVVREIESLRQGVFIFVDENLLAARDFAVELFGAIAPLRKIWLVQAPTTIGRDDRLLDAMAEGGCFNVQIGFQSFDQRVLKDARVLHARVEEFRTLVRKLQDRRMVVSGFFQFGFDHDGPDVFGRTVELIRDLGIDDANLFVTTPFPGTEWHRRLEAEGRLLAGRTVAQFALGRAMYRPENMTPADLEAGVQWAYDALWPHFLPQLVRVARRRWKDLLRNPRFAWAMARGTFRRNRAVAEEASRV